MNIASKFGFTFPNKAINAEYASVMARQVEALKSIAWRAKIGKTAVMVPVIAVKLDQLYKQ